MNTRHVTMAAALLARLPQIETYITGQELERVVIGNNEDPGGTEHVLRMDFSNYCLIRQCSVLASGDEVESYFLRNSHHQSGDVLAILVPSFKEFARGRIQFRDLV